MSIRKRLAECLQIANNAVVDAEIEAIGDDRMMTVAECQTIMVESLVSSGVTIQEWIPVSERLPENNNPVLVRCTNTTIGGGYITHIGSCDMNKFWFLRTQPGIASFPVREWQVTHWMPLPEPPREK